MGEEDNGTTHPRAYMIIVEGLPEEVAEQDPQRGCSSGGGEERTRGAIHWEVAHKVATVLDL